MTSKEYWETYAGGFTPLMFMRLFHCENPAACASAYVSERPALYGIVRRGSWSETFSAETQPTRPEVAAGLAAYLEETEPVWRAELERVLAEDSQNAACSPSSMAADEAPETAGTPDVQSAPPPMESEP
jgi:hypothetical protein